MRQYTTFINNNFKSRLKIQIFMHLLFFAFVVPTQSFCLWSLGRIIENVPCLTFFAADITTDTTKRMTKTVEQIKKLIGSPRNYGE